MKKEIHPKYHKQAHIVCACGNTFVVGSTVPNIKIEICSACHPVFTGKAKFIDKAGRVDKFKEKMEKHKKITEEKKKQETEKKRKQEEARRLLRTKRR